MAKVYESVVKAVFGHGGIWQVGESSEVNDCESLGDWLSMCGELGTVTLDTEIDGLIYGQNGRHVYRLETSYGEVSYHIVEVVD